jgi:hypothetical protein
VVLAAGRQPTKRRENATAAQGDACGRKATASDI